MIKLKTISTFIKIIEKEFGKKNHCKCKDTNLSCFICRMSIVKNILADWVDSIKYGKLDK